MKRYDDAISWWKAYQALSPDKNGYVGMAEVYKAQGKLDRWQGVLDEYLEQKGQGLMHARVRVDMAQFLMSRKEWQKAEVYADAAAETGASWAMLCASDCQEGLGQWDKAERWRQHTSQRYPENSYEWYVWCKRTGKGDVKAAEKLATERIRTLGNQLRASDQVEIAIIQRLIGNHREAMLIFGRLYQESRAESIALHYALACDVAGKTEWRDSAIKDHAGKNTYFGRLLALFQGALAKGEKTSLDVGAVNDLLNLMPQRERNDSIYFLAAFLENRGQGKAAIVHYRNCAASSAHLLLRTLAHDAIRRLERTND